MTQMTFWMSLRQKIHKFGSPRGHLFFTFNIETTNFLKEKKATLLSLQSGVNRVLGTRHSSLIYMFQSISQKAVIFGMRGVDSFVQYLNGESGTTRLGESRQSVRNNLSVEVAQADNL